SRMVIRVRECRSGIDQSEVIGGKSVTHFTSARVEGMALNAILHPNRAHGLPEILLGIASNLLRHFFRQSVFRLVLDSDARHHATLLFYGITCDDKRQEVSASWRCQYIMPSVFQRIKMRTVCSSLLACRPSMTQQFLVQWWRNRPPV